MKRIAIPALLATSALVLTGCLDVDADLSVNADATATGEMTIAISNEVSGFLGLASGVDLVDQIEQGMLEGAEGVEDLDCQPAEREGAVAMTCTFENQVFDQVDDIWNIYKGDDGTVTFVSTSGDAASEEDAGLLGDLNFDFGGYDISVEMPGTITSLEGTNVEQTSDTSFQIQAGLDDTFDVVVTSEDGSSSFPTMLLILGIIVLLAIAGIVAFVFARKGKNNDAASEGAATTSTIAAPPASDPQASAPEAITSQDPPPAIESAPEDDSPKS